MADCGCEPPPVETGTQLRVLRIALALNAAMFFVEVAAGILAQSAALIADGLDMLSDASVYAMALVAIGRSARFKANGAAWSGAMLLVLGVGLIGETIRRFFTTIQPEGGWMIAVAVVALAVNFAVLRMLSRQRNDEVHMRAAWIFTRADVIANAAVIVSGVAVLLTGIRHFDLIVGAGIGAYVVREALEILGEAREAKAASA